MKVDLQMRIEQISKGIVPPGYKKIKSHIVPCEWDVFPISEVCQVVSGGTPSTKKSEYWDGEIPWCTPTDITKSSKYISTTEKKITEEGLKNSSAVLLPKNSILMCSRATIGPRAINTVKMATNQGFKSFICNKTKLDYEFFYYLLEMYVPLFKKLGSGSTFLEISKKDVEETKIIIPVSIKEQKGIAEILSTWDKAIELKEKLIEQKKELKKGLMQKLLTGEVRLPGFEGEWKEVKLKDLGVLKAGSAFPEKYQNQLNGKYPFFKVSDMNNEENEKYMLTANNYISEDIRTELKASVIPKNSIVFAKVGAALFLERKRLLKFDSCIDNNMMALVVKENIDFSFVYYLLLNMKLSRYSNVGALPSLNSKDVYSIKCKVPETFEEQKAISRFLSLFDKEISLLQNELLSIEQQKKGLMQLLLTGKVRVKV